MRRVHVPDGDPLDDLALIADRLRDLVAFLRAERDQPVRGQQPGHVLRDSTGWEVFTAVTGSWVSLRFNNADGAGFEAALTRRQALALCLALRDVVAGGTARGPFAPSEVRTPVAVRRAQADERPQRQTQHPATH